jgi:phage terminase small subunit
VPEAGANALKKSEPRRTTVKPPKGLSSEASAHWRRLLADHAIDDAAGLLTLQTGLEAYDRYRAARRAIETEGATVLDRFNQKKPHPLLTTERDSRAAFLLALRHLGLEHELPEGSELENDDV